jgi:curli biogenesis system outer membrane secretion channel CsgG
MRSAVISVFLKMLSICCVFLVSCLLGCAVAPTIDRQPGAVAVWDLERLNSPEQSLADLGELLSAQVIATLGESPDFKVIERQRLLLVLEELNIGASDMASPSTCLRVGKMIGAKFMVFGSYFVMDGMMRLDLRMVEVESGRIVKAAERSVSGKDTRTWLNAAREAAQDLL